MYDIKKHVYFTNFISILLYLLYNYLQMSIRVEFCLYMCFTREKCLCSTKAVSKTFTSAKRVRSRRKS